MILLWIAVSCYFFTIVIAAMAASLWLLVHPKKRTPLIELADYSWCPFRREYQFDMGFMNVVREFTGGIPKKTIFAPYRQPNANLLDLGSGDGRTTIVYLKEIFPETKSVALSDQTPRPDVWRQLRWKGVKIDIVENPICDLAGVEVLLNEGNFDGVTLLNSLHHFDDTEIASLFRLLRDKNVSIFVMDAKRTGPLVPLLIPIFFYPQYLVLSIIGSGRYYILQNPIRAIFAIFCVPWLMCIDQAIGATKRVHDSLIQKIATDLEVDSLQIKSDTYMNYVLIKW